MCVTVKYALVSAYMLPEILLKTWNAYLKNVKDPTFAVLVLILPMLSSVSRKYFIDCCLKNDTKIWLFIDERYIF